MGGTVNGGKLAAKTNMSKHGEDFYSRIGKIGGAKGTTGGFYYSKVNGLDTHIKAGRKGGEISRRGKSRGKAKKVEIEQPSSWFSKVIRRINA